MALILSVESYQKERGALSTPGAKTGVLDQTGKMSPVQPLDVAASKNRVDYHPFGNLAIPEGPMALRPPLRMVGILRGIRRCSDLFDLQEYYKGVVV
jgi:hypothetical protein